jgi:hypothetical protein
MSVPTAAGGFARDPCQPCATGGGLRRRQCQDDAHDPQCPSQSDSRVQLVYSNPVPWGNGVNGRGCYGSVLLDNELWQSLTAMNGRDVPWVHGCVLDHDHDDDHGAPAYHVDGEPQKWLRWPDTGPARLEHVDLSPPGRHSRPLRSAPDRPPQRSTTTTDAPAHRPGDVELPATASQIEALWAITAAIDRLASAIARLGNSPRDEGTH